MSVKCNPQHRQWGCRIESMQLDLFAKPTSTFFLICSGSDGQTVKSDKNNATSHIRHNFEGLIINTPANICNIQTSFCYLDPFFQPSNTFFWLEQWANRRHMVKGEWPCKGPFGLKDPSGWQKSFTKGWIWMMSKKEWSSFQMVAIWEKGNGEGLSVSYRPLKAASTQTGCASLPFDASLGCYPINCILTQSTSQWGSSYRLKGHCCAK